MTFLIDNLFLCLQILKTGGFFYYLDVLETSKESWLNIGGCNGGLQKTHCSEYTSISILWLYQWSVSTDITFYSSCDNTSNNADFNLMLHNIEVNAFVLLGFTFYTIFSPPFLSTGKDIPALTLFPVHDIFLIVSGIEKNPKTPI